MNVRTCLRCGSTEFGQFCAICGGIEFNEAPGAAATMLAAPTAPPQAQTTLAPRFQPTPTPVPHYQPTPTPVPQYQPTPMRPPDWPASQPPPPRPGGSGNKALRSILIVLIATVVLATVAFLVVRYLEPARQALVNEPSATETTQAVQPPTSQPTEQPAPATVVTVTQTAAPPPPPTVDREVAAQQELDRLIAENGARVPINGQWVAMLAGKWVGISDPLQTTSSGSHTFMAADILDEHRAIKNRVSGVEVVLLDSRTFGERISFEGKPLYVTVGLGSFGSREAVLAWCASQYPEYSGQELENRCTSARLTP